MAGIRLILNAPWNRCGYAGAPARRAFDSDMVFVPVNDAQTVVDIDQADAAFTEGLQGILRIACVQLLPERLQRFRRNPPAVIQNGDEKDAVGMLCLYL